MVASSRKGQIWSEGDVEMTIIRSMSVSIKLEDLLCVCERGGV